MDQEEEAAQASNREDLLKGKERRVRVVRRSEGERS